MSNKLRFAIVAAALLLGLSACQSNDQKAPQPEKLPEPPLSGPGPFSKGPSGPPDVRGPTAPPGVTPGAIPADTQAVTQTEEITFSLPAANQ